MRTIVVLGASSSIVVSTLHCFAADGATFILVARDSQKLDAIKADLVTRGARQVDTISADLSAEGADKKIFSDAISVQSEVDLVYIGYGTLTDSQRAEQEVSYAMLELHNNFNSVVAHCLTWADYFEKKRSGVLAVISSVAGDRGRQSNYVYGAAKGGLSVFLAGLRNRLAKSSVSVVTIKPGFIDTPMTAGIKKGPLFVSSAVAGEMIYKGICAKRDVLYVPWFWKVIMAIICSIPERIFKKLSL